MLVQLAMLNRRAAGEGYGRKSAGGLLKYFVGD